MRFVLFEFKLALVVLKEYDNRRAGIAHKILNNLYMDIHTHYCLYYDNNM